MKKLLLAVIALLSVCLVHAQLGNDMFSLSGRFVAPRLVNGVEMVDAFIAVDGKGVIDALRNEGVVINCEFDGFVTARIPVDRMERVSLMNGVCDVQFSRVLDLCTDSTLSVTRAGQVINGMNNGLPLNYNGHGVIVGIIDCGFDYQHSAFKSATDPTACRIVRVYDPNNSTGHPVKLGANVLSGSVFMGEQIDTIVADVKNASHGTHTASIAAGRHVNGYGGMAPDADIVLCSSRTLNTGLNETEVANCIKYIYAYADSVNKPCVISVSASTNAGGHDGKDYLSRAINQLVGPGRIFVIAAGNNASQNYYVYGTATSAKPANFLVDCYNSETDNNYYYGNVQYETWIRQGIARPVVKFHILDKRTNKIVWESDPVTQNSFIYSNQISDFYVPDPSVGNTGYINAKVSLKVANDKFMITSRIYNLKSKSYYYNNEGKRSSNYRIGMSVYPSAVDSCDMDCWMGSSAGRFGYMTSPVYIDSVAPDGTTVTVRMDNFYAIPDNTASIGCYAVSDSVISAGAYVARNSYYSLNYDEVKEEPWAWIGNIYSSSSYQAPGCGPTGKALPTVTAPGYDVVAACSRFSYFNTDYRGELVMRDDQGCVWGIMTGTSMACPTVAGIIAQWLQLNPNLSPSQIKNVIAQTAIKDHYTIATHQFGPNGKIDALAGIIYLIKNDPHFLLGDVNGDGMVSIVDVSLIVDYLLGVYTPGFNPVAADLNQDGEVSIIDVVTLVDSLLENLPGGEDA